MDAQIILPANIQRICKPFGCPSKMFNAVPRIYSGKDPPPPDFLLPK